jgi:hypothetical protein
MLYFRVDKMRNLSKQHIRESIPDREKSKCRELGWKASIEGWRRVRRPVRLECKEKLREC